MITATQKSDFVFDKNVPPRTIKELTEVKTYLVSYVDGEGKDQVRLCFRIPRRSGTFILQERIGGQFVATAAHDWFDKVLSEKLDSETKLESI